MPGNLNNFAYMYVIKRLFNTLTNRSKELPYTTISLFTELNPMQLVITEIRDK